MIKLIIFDWDDVFTIGSKEGYFRCYHAMLDDLGITLPPEEEKKRILARWGQTYQNEISELLKEHPEMVPKACKKYLKHLMGNTFVDSLSIIEGTNELLIRPSKKYTLTLATGVHPVLLRNRIMPKFKIPDVFSHIITAQDLADSSKVKPHPFIPEELMRLTKTPKDQTIFVGDAKVDVLTAQNAGITPVVVLSGHLTSTEAKKMNVKHIIKNITHLEQTLEIINKK